MTKCWFEHFLRVCLKFWLKNPNSAGFGFSRQVVGTTRGQPDSLDAPPPPRTPCTLGGGLASTFVLASTFFRPAGWTPPPGPEIPTKISTIFIIRVILVGATKPCFPGLHFPILAPVGLVLSFIPSECILSIHVDLCSVAPCDHLRLFSQLLASQPGHNLRRQLKWSPSYLPLTSR